MLPTPVPLSKQTARSKVDSNKVALKQKLAILDIPLEPPLPGADIIEDLVRDITPPSHLNRQSYFTSSQNPTTTSPPQTSRENYEYGGNSSRKPRTSNAKRVKIIEELAKPPKKREAKQVREFLEQTYNMNGFPSFRDMYKLQDGF